MSDIEHQRVHFDAIAAQYIDARKSPRHIYLRDTTWQFALTDPVVDLLPHDRPIQMLEPMCGACEGRQIVEARLAKNVEYSGFDYSDAMVAEALKRYPGSEIWTQDVTQYEPDKEYDLIMLVGALHHVADHAPDVVNRLGKALRPGGLFILSEPVHNNPLFRLVREAIYRKNEAFDAETERGFTTRELNEIFKNAGLAQVSTLYPSLLAYVLWGCPEAFPMLDKGPMSLVRRYVELERHFWHSILAKYLTFGMYSVYQKPL